MRSLARLSKAGVFALSASWSVMAVAQPTSTLPSTNEPAPSAAPGKDLEDIIVTARQRSEGLIVTPVAVTAISGADLARSHTDSLAKVAEQIPNLVIAATPGFGGGGSIGIRGISSSAGVTGFEQSVLVVTDGVPISNGWITGSGLFDVSRVEVLKGPQALLFGKNNTAGVIAIKSNDPTNRFEGYIANSYEFVADEDILDLVLSGPLSGDHSLKGRIAFRRRDMKGWVYNTAKAIANPFAPGLPLPAPNNHRFGDRDLTGRVTLTYDPSPQFSSSLKALYSRLDSDGIGVSLQVTGGCGPSGKPSYFGRVDPNGDCVADNHVSIGRENATVAARYPGYEDGNNYLKHDAIVASWINTLKLDKATVTSTTGYLYFKENGRGAFDVTSFVQQVSGGDIVVKSFTQELRLLTNFESPINFMVGAFYQKFDLDPYRQLVKIRDDISYNPVTDLYITWDKQGYTHAKTYSAFAQAILKPLPGLEIDGGLRYTKEIKDSFVTHVYAFKYPIGKVIADNFRDSNISPEVTVSYHPTAHSTLYASYKTGFKSGGFAISSIITAASTPGDFHFGSEKTRGFEFGGKGLLLHNKLSLDVTYYNYEFTDLQVNTFNPTKFSYVLSNAGSVKQQGVDFQVGLRPTRALNLHGALGWNHNRFGSFVGQCFTGQTAAQGCNILPGPAQDFAGRPTARSPEWSGNAGAVYTVPIHGLELSMSGDTFYSAGYFASETLSPASYQSAFWRYNASIRLSKPDSGWSLGVVGRNLSNKYYITLAADRTGGGTEQRGAVARGREIALEGSLHF